MKFRTGTPLLITRRKTCANSIPRVTSISVWHTGFRDRSLCCRFQSARGRGHRTTRRDCADRGRIVKAQCSDEWGVGFPVAASLLTACRGSTRADVNTRANANAAAPARAAWCYGPPGVARALWLAGLASDRSEYCDLAVAAMAAVFERPIPNRRIDAPTLCHGVAGLLQIALRFARRRRRNFSTAAQELTAQLLDAHEPDSRFGYRDLKPSGQRTDNPGLLEGAAGVALVLLATASPEPIWDRILMLS